MERADQLIAGERRMALPVRVLFEAGAAAVVVLVVAALLGSGDDGGAEPTAGEVTATTKATTSTTEAKPSDTDLATAWHLPVDTLVRVDPAGRELLVTPAEPFSAEGLLRAPIGRPVDAACVEDVRELLNASIGEYSGDGGLVLVVDDGSVNDAPVVRLIAADGEDVLGSALSDLKEATCVSGATTATTVVTELDPTATSSTSTTTTTASTSSTTPASTTPASTLVPVTPTTTTTQPSPVDGLAGRDVP